MTFQTCWESITVKFHHTKTANDYYFFNTLTLATVGEKDKGVCVRRSEWDEEKAHKSSLELDFCVFSFCQLTSSIAITMTFPLLRGGLNSKNGFGEIYRGALLFRFFFSLALSFIPSLTADTSRNKQNELGKWWDWWWYFTSALWGTPTTTLVGN